MAMTETERRKFFRVEVSTPVKFRLIEEDTSKPLSEWVDGSLADIGLGGVKIVASMPEEESEMLIDRYMVIELSFQLPGTPKPITATASIAYFLRGAQVSNTAAITFGVSFVNIDFKDKDIIGDFIRQRLEAA